MAVLEPESLFADLLHLLDRVGDENDRCAGGDHLLHAREALLLKFIVADGEDLVDDENVRHVHRRNGKAETRHHAGGIVLHGGVHKVLQFGKLDDLVKPLGHIRAAVAEDRAVEIDVLARGKVGVKARAELDEGSNAPAGLHRALGRLQNAGDDFQKRALAGAVQPDDAERIALFERERYVPQRPELLKMELPAHGLDEIFLDAVDLLRAEIEHHRNIVDFNNAAHGVPPLRHTGRTCPAFYKIRKAPARASKAPDTGREGFPSDWGTRRRARWSACRKQDGTSG